MKKRFAVLALLIVSASAGAQNAKMARWETIAKGVTITRDDWGIAHIAGKTDADVVFGTIYAQAEDDFNRVETNFINSQGRLAEAEGEAEVWRDLRMKLFINPDSMKAKYKMSPAFLKTLMVAWADGLNYYLAKHPGVKPRVITKFEPWMALSFSEGSIGGDIEKVNLRELRQLYGTSTEAAAPARMVSPSRRRTRSTSTRCC
jgi:acyl-homoserine-lactone acylase